VVTAGGALGKITRVGDNFVSVEIAPNIEIQVQKPSITTLLPKGTVQDRRSRLKSDSPPILTLDAARRTDPT